MFWSIGMGNNMSNDEGNIGIITEEREKERQEKIQDEIIKGMYKIFDKLEQSISTLEKVLESHARCIVEMREDNFIPIRKNQIESIEKELDK